MVFRYQELRVILDNNESDIEGVTLHMEDGRDVKVGLDRMRIISEEYRSEIFTINLMRSNLGNINNFLRVMNLYSDSMNKARGINIDISRNNINNNFFIDIIDFLFTYKDKIINIDVSYNNIQRSGMSALINFTRLCPRLGEIKCDYNFVNKETFNIILEETHLSNAMKKKLSYRQF